MIDRVKLIITFILGVTTCSIGAETPYPILFVHGLAGSDASFVETMQYLNDNHFPDVEAIYVFDVVLNADNDTDVSQYWTDVAWEDWTFGSDEINVGRRTYAAENDDMLDGWVDESASIFAVNFMEERIRGAAGTFNDLFDYSNQAGIFKQGYGLRVAIAHILSFTGKDKVVLVGHSMGGLAIREYLQRTWDGTSASAHIWWVEEEDSLAGHQVARAVTIGTPHLGSNMGEVMLAEDQFRESVPNLSSEAVRDLRYEFNSLFSDYPGVYLFGGSEAEIDNYSSFHNYDVNCDGDEEDIIPGICDSTTYNPEMPLPLNIPYTWITSNASGSGDYVVDLARQWLYLGDQPEPEGITDTLLTAVLHTSEGSDYRTLIRGMDEPGAHEFAYEIDPDGTDYLGFITYQSDMDSMDTDVYKFIADTDGFARVELDVQSTPTRWELTATAANSEEILYITNYEIAHLRDDVVFPIQTGNPYYLILSDEATSTTYQTPYILSIETYPMNAGMMAHYSFTGNTEDAGPNNIDLESEGNPTFVSDRFGGTESALYLGGTGDYLRSPATTLLSLDTYTISAWFEASTAGQNHCLLAYGDTDNMIYGLWNSLTPGTQQGSVESWYETAQGSDVTLNGDFVFQSGSWHFVAATRSIEGEFNLYLDGELLDQEALVAAPQLETHFLTIGARVNRVAGAQDYYEGTIDDIRIYNRPLDAVELNSLYRMNGWTSIDIDEIVVPQANVILQNYPNPFNQSTRVNYELSDASHVSIKIYDIRGSEITELVSAYQQPGRYTLQWNPQSGRGDVLESGIYFAYMQAGEKTSLIKMNLIK